MACPANYILCFTPLFLVQSHPSDEYMPYRLALGCGTHLGSDAHGAGVGVALAHHDTAQGDERGSGESELLSTQ